jgi:hypothetical protein
MEIHLLGVDAELFVFVAFAFHRSHTKVLSLPAVKLGVPCMVSGLGVVSRTVELGCATMLLGGAIVRRRRLLMLYRGPGMIFGRSFSRGMGISPA